MFTIIEKGGIIMVPILICSVVSLTITIERALFWLRQRKSPHAPDGLISIAERAGAGEMIKEARKVNHPVARVLAAGAGSPAPTLAMESAAMDEAAGMKRYLTALDTIITLSPLLGLLGTIVGMIRSFDVISLTGLGQPHAVTGGVAEALIATAAGLTVAIATLIPYNYFLSKAEKATAEMERYATRLEMVLGRAGSASSGGRMREAL